MGYSVIMFVILLLMAVTISLTTNYGISKDAQEAPLLAENAYAEHEAGKLQTDMVVVDTKINGTATYTYPENKDTLPNKLNLYLNIKNNGSIVLNPLEYTILFNNSWAQINSTSNNVSAPLTNSSISSLNLTVTPKYPSKMKNISLLVTSGNGVKIITPTSPMVTNLEISGNQSGDDKNCWKDANISWVRSFGEIWPISSYTVYYTNDLTEELDKNIYNISFTTGPDTDIFIGRAFRSTANDPTCSTISGNSTFLIWITARDTHGNEGPPSNTCIATGQGAGTVECNYP